MEFLNIKDISIERESKLAYNSRDHTNPLGTKRDNSKNRFFNDKFLRLYKKVNETGQVRILDLGCSGGGFVRSCINDGCFSLGLEGSDYSKKMSRAEWAIIPKFLKTCDITKEFKINYKKKQLKFHLITAWDVLEHLDNSSIDGLIKNLRKHLLPEGIFIASVANNSSMQNGVELHLTQKPKEWWIKKFKTEGFSYSGKLIDYFGRQFVRGRNQTKENFHLIFSLNPKKIPTLQKKSMKELLFDYWNGGLVQRKLKTILG